MYWNIYSKILIYLNRKVIQKINIKKILILGINYIKKKLYYTSNMGKFFQKIKIAFFLNKINRYNNNIWKFSRKV
jgi:hypothetical protein